MQANNRISTLDAKEAAELILERMSKDDIFDWITDLMVDSVSYWIAEREDEGVLIDLLAEIRPDLVFPDDEALASDAADHAYDAWKDAGLTGHR